MLILVGVLFGLHCKKHTMSRMGKSGDEQDGNSLLSGITDASAHFGISHHPGIFTIR